MDRYELRRLDYSLSEDHQALQPLYHVRCDPQAASSLPMLVREIPAAEIKLPIGNR